MVRPAAALILSLLFLAAQGTRGASATAEEAEEAPWEKIHLPSLVACGECHLEVWEEWSGSLHGRAWTNANVRAATRDFRKKSCRPCHSPRSIFETGLDEAPAYRDFNQEDGVHCLSCHGLGDGVAAARTVADAPCRPRFEPRLLEVDSCFPCHEPTHGAFAEYRTSLANDLGVRCVDCHMPARAEGGGRSHGPHGGLSAEFVQRAIDSTIEVVDGALVVVVRNRTGHRFPGEIPSRAFLIQVELPGQEPRSILLRRPYKQEDREDNRLLPDEERRFTFPLGTVAGTARVELLFQPLPLLPPSQAFVLDRWEGAVGAPR